MKNKGVIIKECKLRGFDGLTEKQKAIVNENMQSLLDGESVKFNENGLDYEIYVVNSLNDSMSVGYMIEEFI